MNIEMEVRRERTILDKATFGEWWAHGSKFCDTLEDKMREIPGVPVSTWKVDKKTAIPAGRYLLAIVDSPKFGPGTITLLGVPGFDNIRVHSVHSVDDTEGCIGVGDSPDRERGLMFGGIAHHVKENLQRLVAFHISHGDHVWLTMRNPA